MQMNGSGMICNGYFYYNPTVRDYGTVGVSGSSGSPTTLSYSPGIGEAPRIKIKSSQIDTRYYSLVFNGTYVSTSDVGTFSMSYSGKAHPESSASPIAINYFNAYSPIKVRYA